MDTSASDPAAYFSADTCELDEFLALVSRCLLYTSPSPRDRG